MEYEVEGGEEEGWGGESTTQTLRTNWISSWFQTGEVRCCIEGKNLNVTVGNGLVDELFRVKFIKVRSKKG